MNLADSEKKNRVSHFTCSLSRLITLPFPPGERQKLITFPITAEESHNIDLQFTAVRRQRQSIARKRKQNAVTATQIGCIQYRD
jgi:hypothetical protein